VVVYAARAPVASAIPRRIYVDIQLQPRRNDKRFCL
jgi:hypothetical protein